VLATGGLFPPVYDSPPFSIAVMMVVETPKENLSALVSFTIKPLPGCSYFRMSPGLRIFALTNE